MSDEAILGCCAFVSLIFIMVGILGIYRKLKFTKSIKTMHMLNGVIVDYTVSQVLDEDNYIRDVYFPVYEYGWGGIQKRLKGTMRARVSKNPVGKQVHILVDPRTENAVCLEEKKKLDSVLLIFGVIGIIVLVLVLMKL